jgi:hypothetical protein
MNMIFWSFLVKSIMLFIYTFLIWKSDHLIFGMINSFRILFKILFCPLKKFKAFQHVLSWFFHLWSAFQWWRSGSVFLNADEMTSELNTSLMKMFHVKTLKVEQRIWNLWESYFNFNCQQVQALTIMFKFCLKWTTNNGQWKIK